MKEKFTHHLPRCGHSVWSKTLVGMSEMTLQSWESSLGWAQEGGWAREQERGCGFKYHTIIIQQARLSDDRRGCLVRECGLSWWNYHTEAAGTTVEHMEVYIPTQEEIILGWHPTVRQILQSLSFQALTMRLES